MTTSMDTSTTRAFIKDSIRLAPAARKRYDAKDPIVEVSAILFQ